MMRRILAFFLLGYVLLPFISCDKNGLELSQEEERRQLDELRQEIEALSLSHICENAEDWRVTAIGSKACGGPTGHIAYSTKLDTNSFLKKVNEYTHKELAYNKKWPVYSDCSVPSPPDQILCKDGKPELVWSSASLP
ncbi:hypothetical protein H8S90_09305 [Olivibacter sp. SDN3]|uniref:hypothetical protein n=1 Tax=Olivibacter sp. SDN3 TaxID=2764720 RepID=UPI00165159BA|nr:hypothetical protein [Olivibacter sp. SDN3]QNL51747.1 hypothetical protein H8S90_09305 [Olivibacter sp. SDN3]